MRGCRRLTSLVLGFAMAGLLWAPAAGAAEVADATCPGPPDHGWAGQANARHAQTFTAQNTGALFRAQFSITKNAGTTGDFLFQLRTVDSNGHPTSTILASQTVANTSVPDGNSLLTADFATPAQVTSGQQYALVLTRPGGAANSYSVHARGNNPCPGGAAYGAAADEAFWFAANADDFVFATFVRVPPPNDNFANATPISGSSVQINGTNVDATSEGTFYSTEDVGNSGRDVWYRWTAPATGTTTVDTCTNNYDPVMAVFEGTDPATATRLASNNNASDCPAGTTWGSKVSFQAVAGTTYLINVDGCCGGPQGTFTLRLVAPEPPNADGDGLPDAGDHCPTQSGPISNNGCPVPPSSPGAAARDSSPPQTTITKSPPNKDDDESVKFKFKSSEPGSTFKCKIDGKPFKPCKSTKKLSVDEGKHKFKVIAVDAAGNADPTPDKDKFKVTE